MLLKEFALILSLFVVSAFCRRVEIDFSKKEGFDFHSLKKLNDIYVDCGSETGVINSITITNCTKSPCVFVRGNSYSIDLEFSSKVDSQQVVNHVYGIIAKVPVPFPLPNDNGCTLGIECPVKSGQNLKESVTLPVLTSYPKINLYVKWQVTDDQKKQMVCFIFPVSLQ